MQKDEQVSVKDRFAVVLDSLGDAEERKVDRSAARSCGSHKALETFTPHGFSRRARAQSRRMHVDIKFVKLSNSRQCCWHNLSIIRVVLSSERGAQVRRDVFHQSFLRSARVQADRVCSTE